MLAVALFGALAVGAFAQTLDTSLASLKLAPDLRNAVLAEIPKLAEAAVPPGIDAESRQAVAMMFETSFLAAFRAAMLAGAVLAVASAVCAALTIPKTSHAGAQPPRKMDR
jgi:hypothetical protein